MKWLLVLWTICFGTLVVCSPDHDHGPFFDELDEATMAQFEVVFHSKDMTKEEKKTALLLLAEQHLSPAKLRAFKQFQENREHQWANLKFKIEEIIRTMTNEEAKEAAANLLNVWTDDSLLKQKKVQKQAAIVSGIQSPQAKQELLMALGKIKTGVKSSHGQASQENTGTSSGHGHSHGTGSGHGHSHGTGSGHGHSHGTGSGHGHSHGTGGGHGHSHVIGSSAHGHSHDGVRTAQRSNGHGHSHD